MGKHIVFVGGGHAHLFSLTNLHNFIKLGHSVTLISHDPYHYYSGMGPGMLSGTYRPQDIRFHVKKLSQDRGAAFIADRVVRIDPEERLLHLASGSPVHYDVASFNTGSDVRLESMEATNSSIFTVKPIINLWYVRQQVKDLVQNGKPTILIVGGGPAGVEMAGNIEQLVHDSRGSASISIIAGQKLLSRLPHRARSITLTSFHQRGITVLEGVHAQRIEKGETFLTDGSKMTHDLVILASGIRPSSIFRDSGLPVGNDGGLLVNKNLQSVLYPELFGGGDCIYFQDRPLEKVGVYAVRENKILYTNLMATIQGKPLTAFDPGGNYLLILNLGWGKGLFWRKSILWHGKLAFKLKDYIDKKFMRTFQVSGEREEPFASTPSVHTESSLCKKHAGH